MKKTIIALLATSTVALTALPTSAATLLGWYWVGAGPEFTIPPLVYSPLDAAILLFGGTAGNRAVSISDTTITYTGWVDGYGDTTHLKTDWFGQGSLGPVAQTYSLGDSSGLYNYPAFSAYVRDHDGAFTTADSPEASINYVWATVPEPASWALMIAGFGMVGAALRRRSTAFVAV